MLSVWGKNRDDLETWISEIIELLIAFKLNLDHLEQPTMLWRYTSPDSRAETFVLREEYIRVRPGGAAASPTRRPSVSSGIASSSGGVAASFSNAAPQRPTRAVVEGPSYTAVTSEDTVGPLLSLVQTSTVRRVDNKFPI
jgi:hypothetical protein